MFHDQPTTYDPNVVTLVPLEATVDTPSPHIHVDRHGQPVGLVHNGPCPVAGGVRQAAPSLTDEDVDRIAERLADRIGMVEEVRFIPPGIGVLALALARARYDGLPPWDDLDPRQREALRHHQTGEARLILSALREVTR